MNEIHNDLMSLNKVINEELYIYFIPDVINLKDTLENQILSLTKINNLLIARKNKDY